MRSSSSKNSENSKEHIGLLKVSAMVKRCRLMNPFHMWCIAYAATSQWTEVRQELRLLIERTFKCWVQSRINEKGNKAIRDAHRDNASKVNRILGEGGEMWS